MRAKKVQTAVVAAIAVAAGVHMTAVTIQALPPQSTSPTLREPTDYLIPYFWQDWRLFAPNPISADRNLLAQGLIEIDGQQQTTEWIDVTGIELDVVRNQLIGGRAGYGTTKTVIGLDREWLALREETREAVRAAGSQDVPADLATVRSAMLGSGMTTQGADSYLQYEEAVGILASDYLRATHPDATLVGFRYRIRSHNVTPWAGRKDQDRPEPVERTGAWLVPAPVDADRLAGVETFVGRHR